MSTKVIQSPRPGSVRVIDADGTQLGVMSTQDALNIAQEKSLDLVEVAPKANPPVCKLLDYGKMMYKQSKKDKKPKGMARKEIRLGVRIGDHDLKTKVTKAEKFIAKGHEVLVNVLLKGREKANPQQALTTLDRFMELLDGPVKIIKQPKLSGNKAEVVFSK